MPNSQRQEFGRAAALKPRRPHRRIIVASLPCIVVPEPAATPEALPMGAVKALTGWSKLHVTRACHAVIINGVRLYVIPDKLKQTLGL